MESPRCFRDGRSQRRLLRVSAPGRSRPGTGTRPRARTPRGTRSGQLEILEIQRAVQPAALAAEPFPAAPQRLAGHVDDRQPEVFDRGDARRRRQRVTLAREVVLELVQGPREEGTEEQT